MKKLIYKSRILLYAVLLAGSLLACGGESADTDSKREQDAVTEAVKEDRKDETKEEVKKADEE